MSTGADLIAATLKDLGVQHVFGLVGIPVVEIAESCQSAGIAFYAFRNEQAASYAASVYGYLTNRPGCLLVVGGPGVVHALPGVYNSKNNQWPLVVLAGSADVATRGKGAFQELDQLELAKGTKFVKSWHAVEQVSQIVPALRSAFSSCLSGVPGSSYVDIAGNVIQAANSGAVSDNGAQPAATELRPSDSVIGTVFEKLAGSSCPLAIVGKGCAYAGCSEQLVQFLEQWQIPFLATPMGKGVVPDSHKLNVSVARSQALKSADLILLFGCRLNWMLHFGEGFRFTDGVQFVQFTHDSQFSGDNFKNLPSKQTFSVLGDLNESLSKLLVQKSVRKFGIPKEVSRKIEANAQSFSQKEAVYNGVLNYHHTYYLIKNVLGRFQETPILVSEGANTMDISRSSFPIELPKHRLDAGTNSTMGLGLGYAIAAKIAHPEKLVLAIEGDSAFGFSAMELETAVRYGLGMVVVVMNNGGIYHGVEKSERVKPIELNKSTRYDMLCEALGGRGFLVKTANDLVSSMEQALVLQKKGVVCLLNVEIDMGEQKKISFGWQNKAKI